MALMNKANNIFNNFNTVEKSFEIIKTQKEIIDSLDDKISKLSKTQFHIEGMKKEIISLLGEGPTEERTYWVSDNSDDLSDGNITYLTYALEISKDEIKEANTSVLVTNEASSLNNERSLMKEKYNDICRKYFSLQEKINALNKTKNLLRNSSTKTFKLNLNELQEYGF